MCRAVDGQRDPRAPIEGSATGGRALGPLSPDRRTRRRHAHRGAGPFDEAPTRNLSTHIYRLPGFLHRVRCVERSSSGSRIIIAVITGVSLEFTTVRVYGSRVSEPIATNRRRRGRAARPAGRADVRVRWTASPADVTRGGPPRPPRRRGGGRPGAGPPPRRQSTTPEIRH